MYVFAFSTDVEEVTFYSNAQWQPVCSGHYSPHQTQPPSNPGMVVPTPPGWMPLETHGASGGGQLQEHNPNNSGTTQAATTPSGEWVDIVVQRNATLLANGHISKFLYF